MVSISRVPFPSFSLACALTAGALLASLPGCGRLTGYSTMGPVDEMIPALPDRCGVAELADLTGHHFTALAGRPLTGPLRVLWPGQEVTSEVQIQRVNAQVNIDGRILRLFCG